MSPLFLSLFSHFFCLFEFKKNYYCIENFKNFINVSFYIKVLHVMNLLELQILLAIFPNRRETTCIVCIRVNLHKIINICNCN